ncbi:MAG: acyl carrier protein [Acidobacteria bacterium]|nr:MAG: acyl carrier protein [Acidobacteriota bacterium]
MRNIEQELRQFVIDNFLFGQGNGHLKNDDSFLDKGIIDSTGVLELVAFLEEKYQIKIQDRELIPDNLDSINNLIRFVESKLQVAS